MVAQEIRTGVSGAIDDDAIAVLQERIRGEVLTPSHPGYEDARAVQNGLITRRPGAIVRCAGVADVVEVVNLARDRGIVLSVRGGGHNVAGNAINEGGVVIDLSGMRGVHVDPAVRTARAQGGATWGDVDRETQVFGLATPGGVISTTGIGGLTLHGGWGWLRRKHGYSLDNLLSVEIVTADGQVRTASATEHPDLFWAVRGAGSNFGVVTSFEFALHPVGPDVALCAPAYALEDAATVLPAWRDFMANAPDEISSNVLMWSVPPAEIFPVELHGRPIVILASMYSGDAEQGMQMMQPMREFATPLLDLSGIEPYTVLQSSFDWAIPKGGLYYWKSLYLNGLDEATIDAIVQCAATRPTPETPLELWGLGGAPSRVSPTETAFGRRDAPYLLTLSASWSDPTDTDRCIAWARQNWKDMRRFSDGGLYLNFAGFGEEKEALLREGYGANYDRLATLKAKYDPGNLFRMNLNIKPMAG